ncbi:MAG TPA: GDP-mannose 4,6-dehydratase, partial [Candidatus Elarobacter sp.]
RARGHDVVVADRHGSDDTLLVDVRDALAVRGAVELAQPDAVAHLAAQAFVPAAIADPGRTFAINAAGTLNVLDAVRAVAAARGPSPRVLVTSSADVYGPQPRDAYPLHETAPTRPLNPYAASKVAAEALTVAYARSYGVDAVVTRAFNHAGPGQSDRFAVAAFAAQLARITHGGDHVLTVGNLDTVRDYLDVRDVCEAYALLLEGGGEAGEIYNVASGTGTTMKELLRRLVLLARVPVEVREDPARMRPADVPVSVGDASKLRAATGWEPRIPIAETLRAIYDDALRKVSP